MSELVELERFGKHECGRYNIERLPCLEGAEVEAAAYTDFGLTIDFAGGKRLMVFGEEDGVHLYYQEQR